MKARALLLAATAASLTACASWTPEQRGTAIGAAAGGVVGNVVTGGGTLGTIGGAAAGGVIGHEVGKRQSR
jgi:osmotically inducible lipoprotein OsmB